LRGKGNIIDLGIEKIKANKKYRFLFCLHTGILAQFYGLIY